MSRYLVAYLTTLIAFCAADFVWLGWLAKDFYQGQIGELLLSRPNFGAATLFYLLYAAGVVYFAIAPSLADNAWWPTALAGALLGLLAYATYDLSNLATLKGWSTTLVIVDVAWGSVLTGVVALLGRAAARATG